MAMTHEFSVSEVLTDGSRGDHVRYLQMRLDDQGFSPGSIDGIYGPSTKAAVIRFQHARGLSPDGIAGPRTLAALNGPSLSGPSAPSAVPGPAPALSAIPRGTEMTWYFNPWMWAGIGGVLFFLWRPKKS